MVMLKLRGSIALMNNTNYIINIPIYARTVSCSGDLIIFSTNPVGFTNSNHE